MRQNIMLVLMENRFPMSAYQIVNKLADREVHIEQNVLNVILSQMGKNGLVELHKEHCDCCGHRTGYFSLTEEGKIRVHECNPPLISIGQFAELEYVD